jgi:hypothetical protein
MLVAQRVGRISRVDIRCPRCEETGGCLCYETVQRMCVVCARRSRDAILAMDFSYLDDIPSDTDEEDEVEDDDVEVESE